jgi:hypothetical protein
MFHYWCFAAFSSVGWFQGVTNRYRSPESRPAVSDGFELLQTVAETGLNILSRKSVLSPYM